MGLPGSDSRQAVYAFAARKDMTERGRRPDDARRRHFACHRLMRCPLLAGLTFGKSSQCGALCLRFFPN